MRLATGRLDNISIVFPSFDNKSNKSLSWRSAFIYEIVRLVNEERVGTTYKPVLPRFIAIKTSHLKTEQDFHYIISISKDSKRRGSSFGKTFFGCLKVK